MELARYRHDGLTYAGPTEVVDQHVFIGARGEGVQVVDVSDPTQPRYVTTWDGGGVVTNVRTDSTGRLLVTSSGPHPGLDLLDVTSPDTPRSTLRFDVLAQSPMIGVDAPADVALAAHLALVADGEAGILLLPLCR